MATMINSSAPIHQGGLAKKAARLRNARAIDATMAYSVWTMQGSCRVPAFAPVSRMRLQRLVSDCGESRLQQHKVLIRPDGIARLGQATTEFSWNLSLPREQRNDPRFLRKERHPQAVHAAAKISLALFGLASYVKYQLENRPSLGVPELLFAWKAPIAPVVSSAFDQLLAGLQSGDDSVTAEQRAATWESITQKIRTPEGREYFAYPARFVVSPLGADFATHPHSGQPIPDGLPTIHNERHGDWLAIGGVWRPLMPEGATAFFPGESVAGVSYENRAGDVLESIGFDKAGDLREQLYEMLLPQDRLALCNELRRTLPAGAPVSFRDLMQALMFPGERFLVSEEPKVLEYSRFAATESDDRWLIDFEDELG